jgi:plasmid stability protein
VRKVAQLTVRKVDDELVRALKIRAAENGRSAEAEVRAILAEVLSGPSRQRSFTEHLLAFPNVGEDADFSRIEGTMREFDW